MSIISTVKKDIEKVTRYTENSKVGRYLRGVTFVDNAADPTSAYSMAQRKISASGKPKGGPFTAKPRGAARVMRYK